MKLPGVNVDGAAPPVGEAAVVGAALVSAFSAATRAGLLEGRGSIEVFFGTIFMNMVLGVVSAGSGLVTGPVDASVVGAAAVGAGVSAPSD